MGNTTLDRSKVSWWWDMDGQQGGGKCWGDGEDLGKADSIQSMAIPQCHLCGIYPVGIEGPL